MSLILLPALKTFFLLLASTIPSPYEGLILLYLLLSRLTVLLKRTVLFLKGNKVGLNLVERVSEEGLKWIGGKKNSGWDVILEKRAYIQ